MKSLILAALAMLVAPCPAESRAQEDAPLGILPANDSKTPAEWLTVMAAEDAACRVHEAAHPDEARLLLGAVYAKPYLPAADAVKWPAKDLEARDAYHAWWASEGEAAFTAWRLAGFPASDDQRFLMLHAAAMGLYWGAKDAKDAKAADAKDLVAYGDAVVARGKAILLRGCSGERLARADIRALRQFAMYSSHIMPGGDIPLPGYQGWTGIGAPVAGMTAPDFTLPRMDEVLALKSYDDRNPFDVMDLFRPCIMTRLLNIMTGYEAGSEEERKAGRLVRAKPCDGGFAYPVTLSSFRGKKPVLMMMADATDTWTWSGMVAPLWEPLKQALDGKVEMFFVHTTVHDQFMPGYPEANGWTPGQIGLHCVSQEQRARTAKMCYMLYPTLTIPFLLDDRSEHVLDSYLSDGGASSTYLVDERGTVSFSLWQDECSKYLWFDCDIPYCSIQARHQRAMNLIESNLKALLDAHGAWNERMKPVIPDWRVSESREGTLSAIDAGSGTVTIVGTDGTPTVVAVDAQTRILKGQSRKALADLTAGATVSLSFQPDAAKPCGRSARLVVIGGTLAEWWGPRSRWASAVVDSVDAADHRIVATVSLPLKDCKGPGYWETAGPEMLQAFGARIAVERSAFQAMTAMMGHQTTLHLDRATDLFLDGMTAQIADIHPGDRIGIELTDGYDSADLWPHTIRTYRY